MKVSVSFLVFISFLQVLNLTTAQRLCPTGWLVNQEYNSCYKVGTTSLTKTWTEARSACQRYSAELLSIADSGEKAIFEKLVKNSVTKNFWIGGYKRPIDGLWVWSDTNKKIELSQVTWDFGRPDLISGDCLEMRNNGTYSNQNCMEEKPFFCERPMGISTYCDVDNGWEPVNGTCIKVFTSKRTWPMSRTECLDSGADLAVIKSLEILFYLKDYNKFNNLKFWIGLSDLTSQANGGLHWVNDENQIFNFWGPSQPLFIYDGSGSGNCTLVSQESMIIENCDNSNYFACQKFPSECPDGWIAFKEKCYLINSVREKYTSWFDANTTCNNYGANLVTINNLPEQQFVERELKDSFSYSDFWLGFTDLKPIQNVYTWVTGNNVSSFTNWVDQQPVSEPTRDNCGVISVTVGKWYVSSNCFQKLPYLCEIDSGKQVIPNPSNILTYGGNSDGKPCVFPFKYLNKIYYQCTDIDHDNLWCSTTYDYDTDGKYGYCSTSRVCDIGWTENDIYCYKYIQNPTKLTWIDAQNRCSMESGFLAYIQDKKAQTTVNKIIKNDNGIWFGLRFMPNNAWSWGDGNPINPNFNNWRYNHPNSSKANDCGLMDGNDLYLGEWMSTDCSNTFNSLVCAKYSTSGSVNTVTYPATSTPSVDCGRDWMKRPFSNSCYYFSTKYDTFFNANLDCLNMGGTMVSITSVDEQIFLQSTIQNLNQKTYWIGAITTSSTKGWGWLDSSAFVFTNWDQSQYLTGSNQFCAVISSQFGGQWKTVECNNFQAEIRFNYICKKNTIGFTTPTLSTAFPTSPSMNYGCQSGWSYYKTNQCYKFYNAINDHKSFDEAQNKCKQENANLVEIFSEGENQFLIALVEAKKLEKNRALNCPSGWTVNPNNNMCYKYTANSTTEWSKAKSYCNSIGGDLAVAKNSNENEFLSELVLGKSVWLGIKRQVGSSEWKYTDGTIANNQYSNWQVNNPTNINSMERCVVLRSAVNFKWYDLDCQGSDLYDIVCQRDASIQDQCTQYFSEQTQGGGNCIHKNQCPNNFYVTGLCGQYNDPDLECCLDSDRLEETAWIGMYDELSGFNQVSYKWNSGTVPTYTNWGAISGGAEPGSNAERCVSFHLKNNPSGPFFAGQWKTTMCNYKNSFFCKKPVEIVPFTQITNDPGCPIGFKAYEKKCFKTILALLTWEEAESNCNSNSNSNLVSILDRFEQYWLNQFLSTGNGVKWIGLSDKISQGTYVWNSKDKFTYSNWDREKPDQSPGRCIGMNGQGFWSNYDCSEKYSSICMVENSLYTTTEGPTTTTPVPLKCATGWTEAEGRCHKLFAPAIKDRLNWFDSESYCQSLNGHLSTFKSYNQIYSVMSGQNIYQYGDVQFWIGLNTLDSNGGYSWIDGSPVGYYYWDIGMPNSHNQIEDCINMRNTGRWKNDFCYLLRGWSCEIEKGLNPNKTDIVISPDSFQIVECPNNGKYNWTLYRDKCYYASTGAGEEKATWYDSREFCKSIGGDLLSIHTKYDLQYTANLAGKRGYSDWWIGLNQFSTITSGFVWSDGSPLNFLNWDRGEPNDSHGGEKCVEMKQNSFWNDANCAYQKGFVCEKSNRTGIPEPDVVLPLSFSNGNVDPCDSGYSTFGVLTSDNTGKQKPCVFPFKYKGNLYYECITSERVNPWCATTFNYDTDKEWGYCSDIKCFKLLDQKNSFAKSREACQKDGGGSLASIHNELEYSYITALLRKKKSDYFIGLWAPSGNTFYYEDNSILNFAQWAPNKPSTISFGNERCVVMSVDKQTPALWKNVDCNTPYNAICSKYANGVRYAAGCEDNFLTGVLSENVTLTCPQNLSIAIIKADFGRDQYSMACDDKYHYGDQCESRESTTEKARELCQGKSNCFLSASVNQFTDPCPYVIKQLRVWYQCVALPVKSTGGNGNGANCVFPFKYNNALHYQCSYENHPNFDNKKWCCTNSDCDNSFTWGDCPESNVPLNSNNCTKPGYSSFDSGNNCYKLFEDKKLSWKDAKDYCENTEQGKLTSISDVYEQGYMRLISYASTTLDPWIGLIKNNTKQYYWSDNWPVQYTNWAKGWENEDLQSCGFIYSSDGKWNSTSCDAQKSFVCKISNEPVPIITPPPPGICPSGWTEFGYYCYKLELSSRTYPEAKFDCVQKGGYLTSINNQDELEYIQSLTNNVIWIGLEKNFNTGVYEWNDGSPLSFTSYSPTFSGQQTCVYMTTSTGLWMDANCFTSYRSYMCKTNRKIFQIATTTSSAQETTPLTTQTTTISTTTTTQSTSTVKPTTQETTYSSSTTSSISTSSLSTSDTTIKITTVLAQTEKPNGLSGGSIFGIIIVGFIVLIIVAIFGVILLKKKKMVNIKLPFLDSIFFPSDDLSKITLTYKKHPDDSTDNGITNPSYNT